MLTGYLLGRLSQPTYYGHTRDWVYLHYDSIDPIRREELFRENAQLRADIDRMRASGAVVQEVDLPMDSDLMYNDNTAHVLYQRPSFWRSFFNFMGWVVLAGLIAAVFWMFFKYRSKTLENL